MKNFFIRILLFICSLVAFAEGVLFFMITFGRISSQGVISFYTYILQIPETFNVTLGFGIGYSFLGFVLLRGVLRYGKKQKLIIIREKEEILCIPSEGVREVVDQILEQTPSVSDFDTRIANKGERLYLNISLAFNSAVSVRQEINRMRKVLKDEIGRIFEFSHLEFNFQIKSIGIKGSRANYED